MADLATKDPQTQHDSTSLLDLPPEDGRSAETFYTATDDMLRSESNGLLKHDAGLRIRFLTKSGQDDDDIDTESAVYDHDFPALPLISELPEESFFGEMKHECAGALHAGVEFLSETTDRAEKAIQRVWKAAWTQTPFHGLPDWLKDNDFLCHGHRPQIESFKECFKSIFRIHTETGNIWTHLLGCIAFIAIAAFVLSSEKFPSEEKWVFAAFFAGAIICMGFSFVFHTVHCHSQKIGKIFGKLDYCGIAFLTIGSFIPWLHFGFYCKTVTKIVYLAVIGSLSLSAVVVSLWDKFGEPEFRAVRAGVFVALGLSGVIPAIHYIYADGWERSMQEASLHWLMFMGFLYVFGALLYAYRVPERWFPGRFDIWFQSHQIFHVLVVIAAFVHYHGISMMANYRFSLGKCPQLPSSLEWLR